MIEKFNQYVGLPYKPRGIDRNGLDCWGLVRLVLDEQFNIKIPEISYNLKKELREMNPHIKGIKLKEIDLKDASAGDVVRMVGYRDQREHNLHVGIFINHRYILHSENELTMSRIEDVNEDFTRCKILKIYKIVR